MSESSCIRGDKDCQSCKAVDGKRKQRRMISSRPERTQGQGSGYVRGMPFWTHVTTSYGRETR